MWFKYSNLGHAITVDEAVEIGNYFVQKKIFSHVKGEHLFENKYLLYRFESDANSFSQPKTEFSWHKVKKDEDGKVIHPEDVSEELGNSTDWHVKNPHHLPEILLDGFNRDTLDNWRPIKWVDPTDRDKYDLIAIGAGAGGLVSALSTTLAGGKAAIIERNLMGGDCLNTGCVPSKAFLKCAKVAHTVKESEKYGVAIAGDVKIDFARVMQRVREVRAEISEHDSVYKFASKYKLDIFLGDAKFVSKDEIEVNNKRLKYSKALIATGGSPRIPKIEGLSEFPYFTSENVFNITKQPKKLIIVGSGPIGWELGQWFARFGTQVTIISRTNHILGKEDFDISSYLHQQMIDDGVTFKLKSNPLRLNVINSPGKVWNPEAKFELEYEKNGVKSTIEGDSILFATGRKPNVLGMGLEDGGIYYDLDNGIKIDDYCQTTNPNVYAVGDVCFKYQFTHNSDQMAKNAVKNALQFGSEKTSKLIMSWVTYTDPEVAHVGKYAHELDQEGVEYETYRFNYNRNDRAQWESVTGMAKVHCKKGTDKILGGSIVGGPAGDLICSLTSAI